MKAKSKAKPALKAAAKHLKSDNMDAKKEIKEHNKLIKKLKK